jgi:O-antigen/teichoic acid export membrane protein/polysaccharide pyruvyl transferase WcaK-like protein
MNNERKTRTLTRNNIFKGFLWQNYFVVGNACLQLISVAVLSRLLTPSDFGLMAIASIFVTLSSIVSQMGVGPAIVQRENLTERHVRVGFTLSLLLGMILTILLLSLSGVLAKAFHDMRLSIILIVVAFSFFFGGISSVSEGILTRELRFNFLVKIHLISFAFGNVFVSILLAWSGYGVLSLAIGVLIESVMRSILCYISTRHSLNLLLSLNEVKELVNFGAGFTIARLFNFGATHGDNFVIGLKASSDFLGFYNRAYQLMMVPVSYIGSTVEKLMFPIMSRLQNNHNQLKSVYLKGCSLLCIILAPISAIMFANSEDIVITLLGPQWGNSVVPLQILVTGVVFRTTYKMGDSLAKAVGAVYARSLREAVYFFCILCGVYFGVQYSLNCAALAVLIAIIINFVLTNFMSKKLLKLTYLEAFAPYLFGTVLFIITFYISSFFSIIFEPLSFRIVRLVLNISSCVAALLLVVLIFPFTLGKNNVEALLGLLTFIPTNLKNNGLFDFIRRRLLRPDNRKIVSVHGSYYGQNYGDILLISLYVGWLKKSDTNIEVNLPLANAENCNLIGADSNGFIKAIRSRCLVYAGGGYFGEPNKDIFKWSIRNYMRHIIIGHFFKWLRKPIAIIGVGVGPISNKLVRHSIISLCNYAEVLAVRDVESKEFLIQYGVNADKISVSADSALTIEIKDIPENALSFAESYFIDSDSFRLLGIHLSRSKLYSKKTEMLFEEIVNFCKTCSNVKVRLLVDGKSRRNKLLEQEIAARELADALGEQACIVDYKSHWELIAVLSKLDLTLTTKLHVGITSMAIGTPVISFPHHSKTLRLFAQLNEQNRCVPINVLQPGIVYSQLKRYLADTPPLVIPSNVLDDALKNKKMVLDFIK